MIQGRLEKMDFLEDLKHRVMVASGSQITEMEKKGFALSENFALWVLNHPDAYEDVLRSFIKQGADIVPVVNAAANRFRLKHWGLSDQASKIAKDMTNLAREIVPHHSYLSGTLGNLGQLLHPLGEITLEEAYESYEEQVLATADLGIDLVTIFTMTDLTAAEAAIRAVKNNTNLPIVACIAFDPTPKGYRTIMGAGPKEAAKRLDQAGADIIGTNCGGVDPAQVTDILKEMAQATTKPLMAKPNAGVPDIGSRGATYPISPEEMAAHVPMWIAAGTRIVSGCCGAGLEHTAKIAEVVQLVNKKMESP